MGKGRDKRKKKEDPAKAAKRAAKQAHKMTKGMKKREGGEEEGAAEGFNNEESIEVTLKRIQKAQSKLKTTEEVPNVSPPTPRANAVFVAHPERESELMLFGGEYWNGELTEAYNDTYFYHTKKGTWARLSSAVNPAPRSSSQGIIYKHFLLIFGGEFVSQTQSQYLHFKDVWRFDSRASEWEELKTLKGGPSSRSGHRMVLWKRNALIFGGFYDNAQECRYYNDLWMLSNLEGSGKWTSISTSTVGDSPHPRSGHNMAVYGDTLFVYGGYSTEKFNRFKKSEATVHHDLWMLNLPAQQLLQPQGAAAASTSAAGESDAAVPMWVKVRLGGVPPPIRCGVASAYKDKRMYLFGGVVDIESPGGKMLSTFSNDLFVFHMDSKRFYPVVLRKRTAQSAAQKLKSNLNDLEAQLNELKLHGKGSGSGGGACVSDDSSSDDEDDDIDFEEEEERGAQAGSAAGEPKNSEEMKESYETTRSGQVYPHRRMDACMLIQGNLLYIFGGQFESGKREITMTDLFSLNLNRLDTYAVLLSQDLSAAVWLGKESESNAGSWESGSTVVSATFDMDYDMDEEDEEADDGHALGRGPGAVDFANMPRQVALEAGDNDEEPPEAIPAELDQDVTPGQAEVAEAVDALTRRGKKGLHVHKEQLMAQLGASSSVPTPARDELFADFYQRTAVFWETTAKESYEGKRSDRKMKKEAAEFARRRYHEAKELLVQLQLVEEREKEEAKFFRERRQQKEREWQEYLRQQQEDEKEGEEHEDEDDKKGGGEGSDSSESGSDSNSEDDDDEK